MTGRRIARHASTANSKLSNATNLRIVINTMGNVLVRQGLEERTVLTLSADRLRMGRIELRDRKDIVTAQRDGKASIAMSVRQTMLVML
jgi:hypothetical protein